MCAVFAYVSVYKFLCGARGATFRVLTATLRTRWWLGSALTSVSVLHPPDIHREAFMACDKDIEKAAEFLAKGDSMAD